MRTKGLCFKHTRIIGWSDEYKNGLAGPAHFHGYHQLLYACTGVMLVKANGQAFVLPPQRALWIPAEMPHQVTCRGAVSLRTLYLDKSSISIDTKCHILEINPLLRSLTLEIVTMGEPDESRQRDKHIINLLLLELASAPKIPHMAPMPNDPRLLDVCNEIICFPAQSKTIASFARAAGMSQRSFTRHFKQQTGMSLNIWRQQVRLQEALSLLLSGTTVSVAANKVGYESVSAFCTIFTRAFGMPPAKYISKLNAA
ncbi:MAG: helix-turn-helix transcriptional regulator [Pseudomonadota bacterium]